MECEQVLRDTLFEKYEKVTKPSEMPGYEIDVHLDLVLDQILDLSQTDSMIQVRIIVRQMWQVGCPRKKKSSDLGLQS